MSRITKQFQGLKTNLRKFRHEYSKELLDRVKARTPVITGTLRDGWEYELSQKDVAVRNRVPYASFVEYGTEKMEPRAMLRTTAAEGEEIARVAAERAGLRK